MVEQEGEDRNVHETLPRFHSVAVHAVSHYRKVEPPQELVVLLVPVRHQHRYHCLRENCLLLSTHFKHDLPELLQAELPYLVPQSRLTFLRSLFLLPQFVSIGEFIYRVMELDATFLTFQVLAQASEAGPSYKKVVPLFRLFVGFSRFLLGSSCTSSVGGARLLRSRAFLAVGTRTGGPRHCLPERLVRALPPLVRVSSDDWEREKIVLGREFARGLARLEPPLLGYSGFGSPFSFRLISPTDVGGVEIGGKLLEQRRHLQLLLESREVDSKSLKEGGILLQELRGGEGACHWNFLLLRLRTALRGRADLN